MPTLLQKCRRAIRHLRNGTVLDHLKWEIHQGRQLRRQRRLERWWQARDGRPISFVHAIAGGFQMKLFCDDILAKEIFLHDFEAGERKFVRRYLETGDVFIDVGANIGLFTLTAAAKVGPSGRVYAFEPGCRALERLRENVELNRMVNVTVCAQALSDTAGTQSLHEGGEGFDAFHSMGKPVSPTEGTVSSVSTDTLDAFVQRTGSDRRIKMIKIDVEGWESRVIEGGRKTLGAELGPVIQVEFNEEAARGAGSSCKHLYALLRELGYAIYRYDATENTLVPHPLQIQLPCLNLYAIKDRERVVERLNA